MGDDFTRPPHFFSVIPGLDPGTSFQNLFDLEREMFHCVGYWKWGHPLLYRQVKQALRS